MILAGLNRLATSSLNLLMACRETVTRIGSGLIAPQRFHHYYMGPGDLATERSFGDVIKSVGHDRPQTKAAEGSRTPRRWRDCRERIEPPKVLECGCPPPLSLVSTRAA